jgi:hypothetical protein
MNRMGSIFYEDMIIMLRENNNKFVMTRPYEHSRFTFIQQLRITRIRLVANYERLFRQFLDDTISQITTDYDFSFGAYDTRRRDPVDTVGYLICRFNADNFKCLKALDGAECLGKYLACKPNLFTNNFENYSFIVNSQEQRDMVVKFNDAYYIDGNINRDIINPRLPRRTLAEQLRFERAENERIASESIRLDGDVNRTGRSLQNRLCFNSPRVAASLIKIESDTDSNDDFSLVSGMPRIISGKRKSTRMDEEPPSKVPAPCTQHSSNVTSNTGSRRVVSQDIIDMAHEIIAGIIDKSIEQSRFDKQIRAKREAEQAKIDEANRLRRMVAYGPVNDTARPIQVAKMSNDKSTQTRDLNS